MPSSVYTVSFDIGDVCVALMLNNWTGKGELAQNTETHFHMNFEVQYIVHGSFHLELPSSSFRVNENSLILIPPKVYHRITCQSSGSRLCFQIRFCRKKNAGGLYDHYRNLFSRITKPLILDETDCGSLYTDCLLQDGREEEQACILRARLSLVFFRLCRLLEEHTKDFSGNHLPEKKGTVSENESTVILILSYLAHHYREPITLADLACHVNLSPRQVQRIIRETMDDSFTSLLNRQRVNAAKTAIAADSPLSLEELGYHCGFASYVSFWRNFRMQTDMTPEEYRSFFGKNKHIGRETEMKASETMKLAVNIDGNTVVFPFLERLAEREQIRESDLWRFVDCYAQTQVTDLLFCILWQISSTDSTVIDDYRFKYLQKEENGYPVDYREKYRGLYTVNQRFGIDPYRVWIQRAKEQGIRPWLSFRMNDCHHPNEQTSFIRPRFFYEARENGWMIGEEYGYFKGCLDFSISAVQKRFLSYLREQLARYDVYGIELDFLRELFCFRYSEIKEPHTVMTAFLAQVKAVVSEAERVCGHRIRIAIRLMRDIAQNKAFGFDAETMVSEGLVDRFIISPRWASCDSDMPVAEWKERFPSVPVTAGLEILVNRQDHAAYASAEAARGYAAHYLSEGSDGIYLFNYYIDPDRETVLETERKEIYRTAGEAETLMRHPSRYIVTYQDIAPQDTKEWKPLPRRLSETPQVFRLKTGLPGTRKRMLVVGIGAGEDISCLRVLCNGVPVGIFQPFEQNCPYAEPGTLLFRAVLPAEADTGEAVLSFTAIGETAELLYLELRME